MTLADAWCILYVVVVLAVWRIEARTPLRTPEQILLYIAIEATYGGLHFGILALIMFSGHSTLFGWLSVLASAAHLLLAQVAWDRWNRRRKRRTQRVTGKVGLRLGRLVIVPES